MNATTEKSVTKFLATGLVWSGLSLGSLTTVGCDQAADAAAKLLPSAQAHAPRAARHQAGSS